MGERNKNNINLQSSQVIASTVTDGAGAFSSPIRQQGVRTAAGTASGWSFATDGTNGQLTLEVDTFPPNAGGNANAVVQASAHGAAIAYLARAVFSDSNTVLVTVLSSVDGTTAINLATTAVTVQLTASMAP